MGFWLPKECGYETIMINCNPERFLLTLILQISFTLSLFSGNIFYEIPPPPPPPPFYMRSTFGVIVQLGGQTALEIGELRKYGIKIIGTALQALDLADERVDLLRYEELKCPYPWIWYDSQYRWSMELVRRLASHFLVRPSYVLGGQGMKIRNQWKGSWSSIVDKCCYGNPNNEIPSDHFLEGAIVSWKRCFDLRWAENVYIIGIMSISNRREFSPQEIPMRCFLLTNWWLVIADRKLYTPQNCLSTPDSWICDQYPSFAIKKW